MASSLISLLIVLQPFLAFWLATLVANIIARNHWSEQVIDLISLLSLIAMAIFTLWLNGKLEGNAASLVTAIQITALGLLASTMSPLNKYVQSFLSWSQTTTRDLTSFKKEPSTLDQHPPTS